ncbi:MAG: exodeoxyribonuclease VII large subunit [Anaerolineae bacterium]|nr:MAG: exodeoxyribonuclease VII large subunit [Anaerolineae bacterium]
MLTEPAIWTVGSLTRYVARLFALDERMQEVAVEGEVSRFSVAASGHAYFTLKDEEAVLPCVMWRSDVRLQAELPQHGDHVLAIGRMGVYEAGGQYQLYCSTLATAGLGDLHRQFEQLKAQLESEGLFDPERKRQPPEFPARIGVVTSADAAAFQDVCNVLRRRYPLAEVLLAPTLVQGEAAPPQIVAALRALDARDDIDVVLVVRGGGSLEDLAAFNDERVVRAVAASRVPVISGVGHETDFTLTDFAADVRAPTPSAAAELATPAVEDLGLALDEGRLRLDVGMRAALDERALALESQRRALRHLSPRYAVENARQRLDTLLERLGGVTAGHLRLQAERLNGLRGALEAVNPLATLERGYAVVTGADGAALTDAQGAPAGSQIGVHLHRGRLTATVDTSEADG